MKKILLSILSLSLLISVSAQTACDKTLQDYMNQFPESDLCDVYKFCFQDVFGPMHLSLDSAECIGNIVNELAKAKKLDGPLFQYIGCSGNYVRVNLTLVQSGVLTASQLADCLIRSIANEQAVDFEEWKYDWSQIEESLSKITPRPGHFTLDSDAIWNLLDRGGYVVHHSYPFNHAYNFHYRIIRKEIFEQEIKPLIPAK